MKTKAILLALSMVLLVSLSVLADVPDEITYQGRLLYNGSPVTSATNIVFRLYQTSGGGSAVWTETHSSVTPDSNGMYTVILGSTVAIPDDYDALWIELEVAGSTLTPRKKLTSSPFVLRAGELQDLYISGNVGIGTTSPSNLLTIAPASAGYVMSIEDENGALSHRFYAADASSEYQMCDNGGTYKIILRSSGASYLNGGNVGIGTTGPDAKLHVEGTTNLNGTVYVGNGTNQSMYFDGGYSAYIRGGGVGHGSALEIWTGIGATTPTISAKNGKVGIGTTSPVAQLHAKTEGDLVAIFEDGDNPFILLKDANAGANLKYAGLRLNGNLLSLGKTNDVISAFTDYLTVNTSNGYVGIGTTSPGAPLDVASPGIKAFFDGGFTGASLCRESDVASARIGICSSSKVYKEHIATHNYGLDIIERLNPVTFNWKKDGTDGIGFIAEEVEEVLPLLVNYTDGVINGVRYGEITSVLANAVKELKAEVDEEGQEIIEIEAHRKGLVEELEKAHISIEQLHAQIKGLEEKLEHVNELEERLIKLETGKIL